MRSGVQAAAARKPMQGADGEPVSYLACFARPWVGSAWSGLAVAVHPLCGAFAREGGGAFVGWPAGEGLDMRAMHAFDRQS